MCTAGFITISLEDGCEHMTDRAFTIRAGNMNAFECLLRVIKENCKGAIVLVQVLFKSNQADPAEHGQTGEEIIDGFFVVQVKTFLQI